MRFTETAIAGAFIIDLEPNEDERGFFARTWCQEEMAQHGLDCGIAQCSVSYNRRIGTLRGMHYQEEPHAESKLIRCTAGSAFDVILDLRPESASFSKWTSVELSAANRRQVYVPPGVAHGFQTLQDDTELFYQISTPYHPESARGVRWDDPAFSIAWPVERAIVSERDRSFAPFETSLRRASTSE